MGDPDIFAALASALGTQAVLPPEPADLAGRMGDFGVSADATTPVRAIVRPASSAQVAAVLGLCDRRGVPVVVQGGLTGLVGGATPTPGCVILAMDRMAGDIEIDRDAMTLTAGAGTTLAHVQSAAEAAGLFFPLDLGARGSAQLGGLAATNAGGVRVLRYGMMRQLVLGLEVVLPSGEIVSNLNKKLKDNAGYDLRQLFIGSEGTLGVITRVVVRLFPLPRSVNTALCAADSYEGALKLLALARDALASDLSAFEVMWPAFFEIATEGLGRRPPLALGQGLYVLVETLGTDPEPDRQRFEEVVARALDEGLICDGVVAQSGREAQAFWAIRDSVGEFRRVFHPRLSFDVSIDTGRIQAFVDQCQTALRARWPDLAMLFFGHIADSNLHISIRLDPGGDADAIEDLVYRNVAIFGGSISAEHGIGLHKRPYLALSRSLAERNLMARVKVAIDPAGTLNPGKII